MRKSPLLRPLDGVRRNHALEHATIAVLMENGVRPPLAGYSVPGGFLIYGLASTELLSAAASQALERLQSGERELAVSPYCGSNLVVGAALAGIFAGAVLYRPGGRLRRLPLVLAGSVVAAVAGRPLGKEAQRRYTTLPDAHGVEVTGVIRLGLSKLHWVGTRFEAA